MTAPPPRRGVQIMQFLKSLASRDNDVELDEVQELTDGSLKPADTRREPPPTLFALLSSCSSHYLLRLSSS